MLRSKILFVLILFPFFTFAQDVVLKGNIPEYSGEKLTFLTFADQITYVEKELCSIVVDKDGDFSCSFDVDETMYIFLHLGVYDAFIFIEPGKEYDLLFPEREEKSMADKLNPYFDPIQYHLGLNNISENELNYQLAFFDEIYSRLGSKNLVAIYNQIKNIEDNSTINDVDTVYSEKSYSKIIDNSSSYISKNLKYSDVTEEIKKVDSVFSNVNIKYFNDFKRYKFAFYLNMMSHQRMKSISNTYYLNEEMLYNNPAYMELFNQVYEDYFQYFGRTESGKQIYKDIGELKSVTSLKRTLGQDSILTNDTLKELVILKCLHDEFYNDKFSRFAMLTILDSLKTLTKIDEHKLIANNIREKVTKLMVGFEPPKFELLDLDSNLVNLDSYKGTYIYLSFCTTISYACIKELGMLQNLHEKHKNNFKIVVICMDENLAQVKRFVDMKGYQFEFLYYGNQSEVFKDYDVRAFPTYYFIDKEGKLAMSPAPSPDQNSEFKIFQIMRARGDL